MSDPTPTGPAFLPWLLGGIAAAIGALWAALQSGRAKEIARLEAALKHEQDERTRERQEHADQLERLGARLDDVQEAREKDQRKMARVLMLARSEVTEPQDWEEEAPTGVHKVLDAVPRSTSDPAFSAVRTPRLPVELDEKLRKFDPYADSTPPRPGPPRPRPKGKQ